jgi:ABC-2 type transport system permease protein
VNYLKLLAAFVKAGLAGETAYRVNFFVQLFQSVVALLMSLGGLSIIFSYTDVLGGWRPDDVLALLGVYFLVGGVIGLIIQPGMEELIESVREGTFDFTLAKPVDAQLLVSIQRVRLWEAFDILFGLGILAVAVVRMGGEVGVLNGLQFVAMLVVGGVIVYSFWLMLATLSFWFIRVINLLTIFQSMYEAGRWPVTLYPGWLRYGLTFIVPVAFATTVPAQALSGRLTWPSLLLTAVAAAGLFAVARVVWRAGLRHYSGASA